MPRLCLVAIFLNPFPFIPGPTLTRRPRMTESRLDLTRLLPEFPCRGAGCNGRQGRAPMEFLGGSRLMTAHAASHVYFGLNAMWVSTCILAITYATIMSEKVQPRDRRAGRRRRDDPGRRARPGRGDPRHRLEHHRPAHRHDDPGVDLAPLRHVPVSRHLVGARRPRRIPPAFCSSCRSPPRCSRPSSTTSPRCC